MAKFEKGKSGNPGGRPKELDEIKRLAQQHGPAAVAKLAEWLGSENPKASVAACQALLDRGYGKPAQVIAGDPENPLMMLAAVEQSLNAKLDRVISKRTRSPKG